MNGNTEVITGDLELTITRIFDAPRELVFRRGLSRNI